MNKLFISIILLFITSNINCEEAVKAEENEDFEIFLQPMISEGIVENNQTMFEMEEDHERLCGVEGRLVKERGNYLVQCSSDDECLPPSQCHSSGFCCMIALNQEPPPVGCPMGTRSLRNSSGTELTCNPAVPNSCPGGAMCYTDSLTLQKRCCAADPGQGCPAGSRAILLGEQPQQCIPGRTVCPNGALCQWSHLIDRYQCCEPDNGCPRHQAPLKTDRGDTLTCSPGSSPCPGGATCKFNFWTASHQCCKVDTADLCPAGSVPFLRESDSSPKSCKNDQECPTGYLCGDNKLCCGAPGSCPNAFSTLTDMYGRLTACTTRSGNSCPAGSSCQPTSINGQRICCVQEDYQCPGDATPYPNLKNPHICNLADPYACPHGQCMPSNIMGVSICCKSSFVHQKPTMNNPCPAGWALQDNQVNFCTPNSFTTTCPGFSSCMRSATVQQQFVCCVPAAQPSSDTCRRVDAQPERLANGITRRCAAGSGYSQCGNGFSCQPSVRNGWLCCSNPPFAQAQTFQYLCPLSGQQPVLINGINQFCSQPGQTGECPPNTLCLGSRDVRKMNICCRSGPSTLNPICPNNAVPQPSNTGYVSCSIGLSNCAPGYICSRAANDFNIEMCCSSNSLQQPICPDQQTVLMVGGRPQYCTLNRVNPCPSGYACQLSLGTTNNYICCTVPSAPQCPNNFVPALNAQGSSIFCNLARPEGCPSGSICLQASNSNQYSLCCRNAAAPRICPNNQDALLTQSGTVETCSGPGSFCSRSGYTCQYSSAGNLGYVCCGNNPVAAVCADGKETYYQTAGQTYTCNPLIFPSGCPVGYDCSLSNRQGTSVCCRTNVPILPITPPVDFNQCPNGWNPYRNAVDNQIRTCFGANDMSCPIGYSCTPSSQNSRFLCCRLASDVSCPIGSTYLSNSQPRLCSKNRLNQCPRGYSCEQSTNPTITICCSTQQDESIKCPDNSAPSKIGDKVRFCPTVNSLDGCPVGFICLLSNKGINVCCHRTSSVSRFAPVSPGSSEASSRSSSNSLSSLQCPNGVSAGILTDTCQTTEECPKHSSCMRSLNVPGVALCCSNTVPPDTRCNGRRTLLNGQQPVDCLLGQICFDGYECSSQTTNGRSVCCETEILALATCPQNRVPYIVARTEKIMYCDDTAFMCPQGYDCKQTIDKSRHVCCSEELKCASGTPEYTENGMIKRCFSADSCGTGYSCMDSKAGKGQLCCSEGLTPVKEDSFSFPISTRIQDSVVNEPKSAENDDEWVIVEG